MQNNDGIYFYEVARYYGQRWQRTGSKSDLGMFTWALKRCWSIRGVR